MIQIEATSFHLVVSDEASVLATAMMLALIVVLRWFRHPPH